MSFVFILSALMLCKHEELLQQTMLPTHTSCSSFDNLLLLYACQCSKYYRACYVHRELAITEKKQKTNLILNIY